MAKIADRGQLTLVGGNKIGNIDARLRPAQRRRQRNEQHRRKIGLCVVVTRVANCSENRDQRFHPGSPESGKPSSEPISSAGAIALYSDAIPLPERGRELSAGMGVRDRDYSAASCDENAIRHG